MSFTATLFPIIAALAAPEGIHFKLNNRWYTLNEQQHYFIELFFEKKLELSHFHERELRSWVSGDADSFNAIARENGFSIQLDPFDENEFGSLSILDVAVQWKEEGTITTVEHNNTLYKATELTNNFCVIQPGDAYPIIRIVTKTDDVVYISEADEQRQEFILLHKIDALRSLVKKAQKYDGFGMYKIRNSLVPTVQTDTSYSSIIFPHVKLDQEVDISWLCGMRCPHPIEGFPDWRITRALQQTKFAMDEKGAHVESAVAIAICGGCCITVPPRQLIIDKPFYLWIERPGCTVPVFAGYIDPVDWIEASL